MLSLIAMLADIGGFYWCRMARTSAYCRDVNEKRGSGRGGRGGRGPAPDYLACAFRGRTQPEVRKLIAGPSVYICDGCVKLAGGVIGSGRAASTPLG
jgi:hypothetical protein